MKKGKEEFTLVMREDHATGEMGWCLSDLAEIQDMPSVAMDPYLIAHDIIEHVNGVSEIGGVGEELQAMGGIWNCRGQHCDITRERNRVNRDPVENVASDVAEMARRIIQGGEDMGCEVPDFVDCGYDDDLEMIWKEALSNYMSELSYDDEEIDEVELIEYKKAFRALFSLGVRKHEELYGNRFKANSIFYYIVEELGETMKHVEEFEEIKIIIDYDEAEVKTYSEYPYDEEEVYA